MEDTTNQKQEQYTDNDSITTLQKQRILSEIRRNDAEIRKLKIEAEGVQRAVGYRWYFSRISQVIAASAIAAGLFVSWFIGYFQPILNKNQEITRLENKEISLRNKIKHAKLMTESKRLSDEKNKLKNDYHALLSQHKALEKERVKMIASYEKIEQELEVTKDNYSKVLAERDLSVKQRKKYEKQLNQATEKIAELELVKKQFQDAQAQSELFQEDINKRIELLDLEAVGITAHTLDDDERIAMEQITESLTNPIPDSSTYTVDDDEIKAILQRIEESPIGFPSDLSDTLTDKDLADDLLNIEK
jgi:hypothetical protein